MLEFGQSETELKVMSKCQHSPAMSISVPDYEVKCSPHSQHYISAYFSICSLSVPLLLSVKLYVPLDQLKAGKGEGCCWCCPQQVGATPFVKAPQSICLPDLHKNPKAQCSKTVNRAGYRGPSMYRYPIIENTL